MFQTHVLKSLVQGANDVWQITEAMQCVDVPTSVDMQRHLNPAVVQTTKPMAVDVC